MGTYADATKRQKALEILERLEASGQMRPAEAQTLQQLREQAAADAADVTDTQATYSGALQGATINAADEVQAGIKSIFTDTPYDEEVGRIRADNARLQGAAPEAYGRGEIAGAIATSTLPGGAAMKAMRGAPLWAQILGGGAAGGGLAALQGFFSGEGWADKFDKATDPVNTAIGAGIAGGAPVLGRVVGRGVQAAAERLGGRSPNVGSFGLNQRAGREVNRAFQRNQQTPQEIQDYLSNLGPEGMIADIPGNPQARAMGLASVPGEHMEILRGAVEKRAADASPRITGVMDRTLGPDDAAYAAQKAERGKRANIGKDYEVALQYQGSIDSADAVAAIDAAAEKAAPQTKAKLLAIRKGLVDKTRNAAGDVLEMPVDNAERLHWVRSELRDTIENMGLDRLGPTQRNALKPVLAKLDEALDAVPGYTAARNATADSYRISRAVEAGQEVFTKPVRPDALADHMAGLTAPEREAFKKGARDAIAEAMGTVRNAPLKARTLLEAGWNEEKLRLVIGDQAADDVMRQIRAEVDFSETRTRVLRGSDTSLRTAAKQDIEPLMTESGSRAGPWTRGKQTINDAVNPLIDALLYGGRPDVTRDMAKIMAAQGPERDMLVKALLDDQLKLGRASKAGKRVEPYLDAAVKALGGGVTQSRAGGSQR